MKKTILVIPILAMAGACETTENRSALTGAAAGAALGAAVSDEDDRVEGALIGGAAGAVVGDMIGRANTPGDCVYEDRYGRRYVAECP